MGFTETGGDNVALIRKEIHNRELKIKEMTVGERGKVEVIHYVSSRCREPRSTAGACGTNPESSMSIA